MDIQKSKKSDLIYLLLASFMAAGGAIIVGLPNPEIGLFAVMGLLVIGLMMAIYIRPNLGADVLIIAVFANISRQFTDRGLPSINKPLVVLVAVAILVRYLYAGSMPTGRRKTTAIEGYLFLFFIVTAFSYLVASDKGRAIDAILDLGKDIVIIYSIFFTLRRPEVWKQSAWIIILITAFLCLLGTYQVVSGNYDQRFFGLAAVHQDISTSSSAWRIAGPINEPNIWGQIVVAVVPLVLSRVIHETRLSRKLLSLGILGLLLFEILNTYSRGAYLALLIIFVLILLGSRHKVVVGMASIGLAVLAFAFLPSSYKERFQTLSLLTPSAQSGIYQEASFRGRSSEMFTGLNMFATHPLLGVGAGNYPNNYPIYSQLLGLELRSGEREPHSLYIQVLAETGIIGAIGFIGFTVTLILSLYKARKSVERMDDLRHWRPWIQAIQLSIIGYLITSFFLHGAYLRYFWIFSALAIAAVQLTEELINDPDRPHFSETFV
jgi:O-antigen ligase